MVKISRILAVSFLLFLTGCGMGTEGPYRVDTVVQIPVDPTEESQMPEQTEAMQETAAQQELTEETEPVSPEKQGSSGKSTSSGRKPTSSGKTSGSSQTESPKETQPAATEPPATRPVTEATGQQVYDPSSYIVGSLEYAILDAVNAYRTEAGMAELSVSTKLSGIAALRAAECRQVWSHTRPDGRSYTTALSDYGYGYGAVTENLIYAAGPTGQQIADKWMEKDNRESLLSGAYTTAGIGIETAGGVTYVVCILVG